MAADSAFNSPKCKSLSDQRHDFLLPTVGLFVCEQRELDFGLIRRRTPSATGGMSESLRFVLLDERSLLYVRQFLTATPRAGSSAIMSFLGLDHRNQAAEITPRHLREKPR